MLRIHRWTWHIIASLASWFCQPIMNIPWIMFFLGNFNGSGRFIQEWTIGHVEVCFITCPSILYGSNYLPVSQSGCGMHASPGDDYLLLMLIFGRMKLSKNLCAFLYFDRNPFGYILVNLTYWSKDSTLFILDITAPLWCTHYRGKKKNKKKRKNCILCICLTVISDELDW